MDEGPFEQERGKALWFAHAGADGSPLTAAGVGFGQYPAARIRRRGGIILRVAIFRHG